MEQILIRKEDRYEEIKRNNCPICSENGRDGALCEIHLLAIKDFNWLRNYINNLNNFDSRVVYIIDSAISDRKSYIINNVEIRDGKMQIEERINRSSVSKSEKIRLKEILALENAKASILEIIKSE